MLIPCPKCGHLLDTGTKNYGITLLIREMLENDPEMGVREVFEELLKRGVNFESSNNPLASLWSIWKRVRKQLGNEYVSQKRTRNKKVAKH